MGQLWSLHRDILQRIRIFLSPLLIYIISKCAKNGKHCSLMAVFTIEQSATQTNFGLTRVVKVIAVIFFFFFLYVPCQKLFFWMQLFPSNVHPQEHLKVALSRPFSEDLSFYIKESGRQIVTGKRKYWGLGRQQRGKWSLQRWRPTLIISKYRIKKTEGEGCFPLKGE